MPPIIERSPLLLLGGEGMLGQAFRQLFAGRGLQVVAPSLAELDITSPGAVDRYVPKHGIVINSAAWTDVDGAEDKEAEAFRINADAVGALALLCRERESKLVHFSTDYVFDGQATGPYRPDAPIKPLNAYGRSKAEGERLLRSSGVDHVLVRTSWLYAPWGKNFVRAIASRLATRTELEVVSDQVGKPTSAEHLASVTAALLDRNATGIFHVTDGGEPCSWFDFAQEIARCLGSKCIVRPCSSARYASRAVRPAHSVLDTTAAESLAGSFPDWRQNVAAVCARLHAP